MANEFPDFVKFEGFAGQVWYHQHMREKRILRRAREFTPERLFKSGEQGVWYDPSDTTTLFQDSAGTTPVTASGQPVGLMLDKSKGLARGPELVTNGTFDADLSGWLDGSGTGGAVSWESGGARFISNGAAAAISQSTGAGWREVTIQITEVTSGQLRLGSSSDGVGVGFTVLANIPARVGTHKFIVYQPLAWLMVGRVGACNIKADNISVRELPGNHATQPTAASRPLYRSPPAKIDYDGVDDVLNVTFPVSMGSNVTIARAIPGAGAQILTGQIVGTTYADNVDHAGLIIINRALTAAETVGVTNYLNSKAGV